MTNEKQEWVTYKNFRKKTNRMNKQLKHNYFTKRLNIKKT